MITKLLNFYDFAPAAAAPPPFACANENSRGAAGESFSRAVDTRHIPHLRAPLECRWQIDPMTGALLAHWVDPSADNGAAASFDDIIDARRCWHQPVRVTGGSATMRSAA